MKTTAVALLLTGLIALSPIALSDDDFTSALSEYLEFALYSDGVLTSQQLDSIGTDNVILINTGSTDGYGISHIPGSLHIDWREVLKRQDEIPKQGMVVVYCRNSLVSAKAQLILSLAGYDNVKVLSKGYIGWQEYLSTQNTFAALN